MNAAHLHLIVNHLPIVGSLLALPLLLLTLWRRQRAMLDASVVLLVLAALGGGAAWLSGGEAEEIVEDLPGIREATIEEHEEIAEVGGVLMIVAGAVGVGAWFMTRRKDGPVPLLAAAAPLVVTAVASVALGLAGQSGGQIRHPEAYEASTGPVGAFGEAEEDEAHERNER